MNLMKALIFWSQEVYRRGNSVRIVRSLYRFLSTPSATRIINEPIEEETVPADALRYFHPTKARQILDGRFKTIAKLGYGGGSTVWLSRESHIASCPSLPRASALTFPSKKCTESSNPPHVNIKISALFADAKNEMEKLHLIQNANPSHEGYPFIHTPLDHFDLPGRECTHACLVYEPMREALSQYQKRFPRRGIDDAHVHLAAMMSLLGAPPEQVIETEQYFRKAYLRRTITNPRGRACATMNESWGGPFFSDNVFGQLYRADLVREDKTLSDIVTELTGQEKDDFVDFAGNMLRWMPGDRTTAKELQRHPFVEAVDRCFEKD